jgi:hypothetical protein
LLGIRKLTYDCSKWVGVAFVKYSNSAGIFLTTTIMICLIGQTLAKDKSAELAAGLLAKAQSVDEKCKFLNATEHDQISNLVARAEVALARRESIAETKSVMARNSQIGINSNCSESERSEVASILAAAQSAISHVSVAPQVVATAPNPIPANQVRLKITAPIFKTERALSVKSKTPSDLKQYASITERYYFARRCGSMTPSAINSFYKTVVSAHKQVVSNFGRRAVASIMSQSESSAGIKSCS